MRTKTGKQGDRRSKAISRRRLADGERSLLAAIVESSNDAIISKTLEGTILSWNPAAEGIFGYTSGEAVGRPIAMLFPPERLEEEKSILARIARGERVDHFETVRLKKDGTPLEVSVTISPVRDTEGRIVGASKIVRDITAQKETERELSRYRDRLEELVEERTAQLERANKEMEAFSYSVSHDLRAPLRHIGGFADLLLKHAGGTLDEKGTRLLATISRSATEMGVLIDELLAFSRMGRMEVQQTALVAAELVGSVIGHFAPETNGRDVDWQIGYLPVIRADPSMLRLVFENLIGNALKYTRGREKARIEIGSTEENGELVFFVRDNGVGFDMQYAHKLFGVFQRLHGSDEFEGTGIGLANVRRIVHRHGGRTWAEGKVDQGAAFYFSLPISRET